LLDKRNPCKGQNLFVNVACAMEKIPAEATHFYEFEGEMVTAQKDGTLQPVMGKIKQMLETALGIKQQ
jgi:hypothetical protein